MEKKNTYKLAICIVKMNKFQICYDFTVILKIYVCTNPNDNKTICRYFSCYAVFAMFYFQVYLVPWGRGWGREVTVGSEPLLDVAGQDVVLVELHLHVPEVQFILY